MVQDTQINTNAEAGEANRPSPLYVRTLLVVVIGLGVVLLVGATIVVGTIVKRINNPEAGAPVLSGFGTQHIDIGTARLVDVENGDTRVILRLEDVDGSLLVFVDPRKGIETGRLRLKKNRGAE